MFRTGAAAESDSIKKHLNVIQFSRYTQGKQGKEKQNERDEEERVRSTL